MINPTTWGGAREIKVKEIKIWKDIHKGLMSLCIIACGIGHLRPLTHLCDSNIHSPIDLGI